MVVRYMTYSIRDERFNYTNHQPASQPSIQASTRALSSAHSLTRMRRSTRLGAEADVGNKK